MSIIELTSRLAALAVAFDDREHVPEEEENADDVGFFDILY